MEMLAAQAAHREDGSAGDDEDVIIKDQKMSEAEKKELLQKSLNMAASNGDVERIRRIVEGSAREWVDVDAVDEEGTPPLVYASCFVGFSSFFPGGTLQLYGALGRDGENAYADL